MIEGNVTIQVTKTADGEKEYMQIMTADMVSINIVLVAEKFIIKDDRDK